MTRENTAAAMTPTTGSVRHDYRVTLLDGAGPRQVSVTLVLRTTSFGDGELTMRLGADGPALLADSRVRFRVHGAVPCVGRAGLHVADLTDGSHQVTWRPVAHPDGREPSSWLRLQRTARKSELRVDCVELNTRPMVHVRRRTGRVRDAVLAAGLAAMVGMAGHRVLVGSEQPVLAAGRDDTAVAVDDLPEPAATPGSTPAEVPVTAPVTVASVVPSVAPVDPRGQLIASADTSTGPWIVIPKLSVVQPIRSGTSDAVLSGGVGHYEGTARPGRPGNVALAGHRTSTPAPFRHLDELKPGDEIIVLVRKKMARYTVEETRNGQGHYVVAPTAIEVLRHRGHDSVTLTTCTPVGSDAQRLIVHARFVSWEPAPEEARR